MVRGGHVPLVSDYVIIWLSVFDAAERRSAGAPDPLTQGIQARSSLAILCI